ncbi:DUF6706 family protein [Flavicella sp.]|uniref:DUF6706 family protein n=1 Tax=Flavicella sp. TaxID=2957742 RepID=UPI003017FEA9
MTNKQVIQAKAAFQSLPSATIDKAFIDRSLDETVNYESSYLKHIELITADLYVEVMTSPDFKEGGLSVTYDRSVYKNLAIQIYTKYEDDKLSDLMGFSDGIEDATELW